jgi:poly-gamma-glutamate capsule biosynthesis protein CapA/YwtB (metallophosphatase superfamily)
MEREILIRKLVLLIFVIVLTTSQVFGQSKDDSLSFQQKSQDETLDEKDVIIDFGKTLLGKPYKWVTSEGKVLDCSGFVSYIYGHRGFDLPSSSSSLASVAKKISMSDIKKGDLMFFKGRNTKSETVGHVSIVTSVDGNEIEMMHSCQRGIIVEKYNINRYYTSRLLFAGTLPQVISQEPLLINYNIIPDTATAVSVSTTTIQDQNNAILKTISGYNDSIHAQQKTIKIIAVGDIMLGTNYPNNSYLPLNDGKFILQPVKRILTKGDVVFGNLEGVILTGEGTVKKCSNPKVCYAFKMPNHYVDYLTEAGFNLLSIANNHIRDFGSVGTANTIKVLNEAGIPHAGLEECPYTTFEKNGIRYGFAAFAPNTGTVQINDYVGAKKIISLLDSICDIVVISFHGGAEGAAMKHITRKTEMFLGENRGNPYEFARMAIDAGADVVLGHGPHVTRAIDIYKGKFIAYSLGNFATYGRFNLSGPNGIAPIIELNLTVDGTFISGKIHSTKQLGEGGPVLDEQNSVLKDIKELTRIDIPECILKIESDGTITKNNEPTKR